MDRIAVALLIGFFIDCFLGDPHRLPHPVVLIGKLISGLERVFRRLLPKTVAGERTAGGLIWLVTAAVSGLIPWGILRVCGLVSPWLALGVQGIMCWQIIAPRSLRDESMKVYRALKTGTLPQARQAVSMIVGRDTERMDGHGIARAAIESVAENLTDGVFSTLFWASAGCLAGGSFGAASAALAHRVFNILDAMWGKKNDRYKHFGTFAARTDDALNFIPARLILPCISFSALMVKGTSARRALTMGWAFRNAHASPNSAWSEAAFAGALGLRLGGPVSYKGIPANYPWIGTGRTKASASDLALAIRLMWTTAVTGTLAFTLLLLFIPRL